MPLARWLFFLLIFSWVHGQEMSLRLPTDNHALLENRPADFYQHIDRVFQGVRSEPWEGGQYGFVRDPIATRSGLVYTRFHEGIDIKPLYRDAHGEPLDEVHAIDQGTVVYTNDIPRLSNYGRYIVIEHQWGGCPYYSLYAHLRRIDVHAGEVVSGGQQIGGLGYTGHDINRERAHLHFEINLLTSVNYDVWHARFFPKDINHHGNFNGINLQGLDVASLYLQWNKNPHLTIPQFLAQQAPFYKAVIPASPHFSLIQRYPWMLKEPVATPPPAWEIEFAQSGLPLRVQPVQQAVTHPVLINVRFSQIPYSEITKGMIRNTTTGAVLSESGLHYLLLHISPDFLTENPGSDSGNAPAAIQP